MNTNTTPPQAPPSSPSILPAAYQEDIAFLNADEAISGSIFIGEEYPPKPYQDLEDLTEILGDENKKALIERFEPSSLLDLQKIGLQVLACADGNLLRQLALGTPAKVTFQAKGLLSPMALLVKPSLSTNQKIALRIVPYLKHENQTIYKP
jgi:hypothetical protein